MSTSTPTHVRAISLLLALAVVLGGWLALEYSNRQPNAVRPPPPLTEKIRPPDSTRQVTPAQTISKSSSEQLPRDVQLTFKCQKDGRTMFSDQPCPSGAKEISVTTAEKRQTTVPDNRLSQMKRAVTQMETDRIAREQVLNAEFAARATATGPSKASQCEAIDKEVAFIDAQLRRPHDGQTGDYWTGERRKLMDKRFDLRC